MNVYVSVLYNNRTIMSPYTYLNSVRNSPVVKLYCQKWSPVIYF